MTTNWREPVANPLRPFDSCSVRATGGEFRLTNGEYTTAAIPFDATEAEIQERLDELPVKPPWFMETEGLTHKPIGSYSTGIEPDQPLTDTTAPP